MPDGFSMARAGRAVLLTYYGDFMDSWEPATESRFIPDVVGRFVLFEAYLRERIAGVDPAPYRRRGEPSGSSSSIRWTSTLGRSRRRTSMCLRFQRRGSGGLLRGRGAR